MRIVIRGGVWKNTEDEILKLAVMKYGKNNWSRIASLLGRKTAKQAKARWYEWLDPSIKKTEWTREEEERLLHLAKIMPAQWRSIAPLVGRTAGQCLEHYEKLLDQAQATAEGGAAAAAAALDPKNDPRRLRAGEIDPNPETRPARPDPVDMDDDELEMLNEARARLANTRGKKAKRKVRERQLQTARRLANLQKERELRAAGIDTSKRKRRKRTDDRIDYGEDIPFERRAPAGFYDTSAEDSKAAADSKDRSTDFEGRMLHEYEEKKRDKDAKKAARNQRNMQKRLAATNLPKLMEMEARMNDPTPDRKRSRLVLPAPQVSDREIADIVKMGKSGSALAQAVQSSGAGATAGLVGNYAADPTPMLQARHAAGGAGTSAAAVSNAVMEEAQNMLALRDAKTPLLGGDNPELANGTGFGTAIPRRGVDGNATPAGGGGLALAVVADTPLLGNGLEADSASVGPPGRPGSVAGASSLGGRSGASMRLRDELSINEDDDGEMSVVSGFTADSRGSRRSARERRSAMKALLSTLPAPKYEFAIDAADIAGAEEDEDGDVAMGGAAAAGKAALREDAEERRKREEQARQARLEEERRSRSSVLQAEPPLPRPAVVNPGVIAAVAAAEPFADVAAGPSGSGAATAGELSVAAAAVAAEVGRMLHHDAVRYPLKKSKSGGARAVSGLPPGPVPVLTRFTAAELGLARRLLADEEQVVRTEAEASAGRATTTNDIAEAVREGIETSLVDPDTGVPMDAASTPVEEQVKALSRRHAALSKQLAKDSGRVSKRCAAVAEQLAGQQQACADSAAAIATAWERTAAVRRQLGAFATMLSQERAVAPVRLQRLQAELQDEVERERALQKRFGELAAEEQRLAAAVAAR